MTVITTKLQLTTRGNNDIIDITGRVGDEVAKSGVSSGTAVIFVMGSTGGITTMEYEPGQITDMQNMVDRLVPRKGNYEHNLTWGDGNAHSHLRASLIGPSLTVPIVDGELTLGTWQQIVFIDFDVRPRTRELILQITS